jgi:hypothetical protein
MREACCFQLPAGTPPVRIEEHLATAIFTAECIFGRPRVRLSARYCLDDSRSRCVVDVTDAVGEHVAQVLVGCFTRDFGETGFTVQRRARPRRHSRRGRQPGAGARAIAQP